MKDDSAAHLDATLSDAIDKVADVIRAHEIVMKEFVEGYRELRQKELVSYQLDVVTDVYGDLPKPCLLALVLRVRPVSQAKHLYGYYAEDDPVNLPYICLAKISGANTEHIQANTADGNYAPKKIVRLRPLRFQHAEQREWTIGVIETVNHLNMVAKRLRESYLGLVDMHYNIHKVTNTLHPANYHLRLRTQ